MSRKKCEKVRPAVSLLLGDQWMRRRRRTPPSGNDGGRGGSLQGTGSGRPVFAEALIENVKKHREDLDGLLSRH